MRSSTTEDFDRLFSKLPKRGQRDARQAYRQFAQNPQHPGLHFKRLQTRSPLYSVRIGRDYRAVGLLEDDELTWDFIGSHAEYMRYIVKYR